MRKDFFGRLVFIIVILAIFIVMFFVRLFSLQIVKGEDYREASLKSLIKTMPLKAKRGDILDRYGRVIVTSELIYNLEISKYNKIEEELNDTLYKLIMLMEKENQPYTDNLPVSDLPYSYTKSEEEIRAYLKRHNLNENLTAKKLVEVLCEKYKIEGMPAEYKRKVAGVRAEMAERQFSSNNPYVFAKNVNINIVTILEENNRQYPGVNVMTSYERMYPEEVGSHFLGRVGPIYKEEYEKLSELGYGITDVIGKEGVEKVYDLELKGNDGIMKVEQNNKGKIISHDTLVDAVSGNDIILTIDLNLQKRAEKALSDMVSYIRREVAGDVSGGAVVVQNVHSGEILAIASNPTYSLKNFDRDYQKNYNNPNKPFWNRAISGTYEPGSTYKILTSVAALEEGIVSVKDMIHDKGKYTFYDDYQPVCHVFPGSHGNVNVSTAIKFSCNYYFYDVGRRLGIDNLENYSRKFGLGELTGIEIPGETKGSAASRKSVEKKGEIWYPGNTLQAAIGQSGNLFTPIQLSNYIATVVNGGTRYKCHLLYKIKDHSTGDIKEVLPEVVEKNTIKPENYNAIMEGMLSVTEDGTASNTFRDFEIAVGGKTGTAEVTGTNNALFVAFAPFENPEIAISVVVEHGAHGNTIAPVAKEIIEEYFLNSTMDISDNYNKFTLK